MTTISGTGSRGFTFIELLIVAVLIITLSGIAVPKIYRVYQDYLLRNSAAGIFYLGRILQETAGSANVVCRMDYSEGSREFACLCRQGSVFKKIPGRLSRPVVIGKGITLEFDPVTVRTIYFYPDGTTRQGIIRLANGGGKTVAVEFGGMNGEISIR